MEIDSKYFKAIGALKERLDNADNWAPIEITDNNTRYLGIVLKENKYRLAIVKHCDIWYIRILQHKMLSNGDEVGSNVFIPILDLLATNALIISKGGWGDDIRFLDNLRSTVNENYNKLKTNKRIEENTKLFLDILYTSIQSGDTNA